MSSGLGCIDIDCEAPSYEVVEACRGLGLHSPWDVRWLRMSRLDQPPLCGRGVFSVRRWVELLGLSRPRGGTCPCGQQLPAPGRRHFPSLPRGECDYLIGQCGRCHTIFWERV
jgi:hypothetical protein